MSSLLKKNLEPEIAVFGFPVIQTKNGDVPVHHDKGQPPEPEMGPEELHRRKLLELERRTQEIERDAYNQGFAQGEKDGFDYGQKSVQVVRTQLERIVQNMEALPSKILQDYREWLIRTSIGIAKQIVNREVQTSPEIVADIVGKLVEEAEEHSTSTVFLNPHDLEIVEKRGDLTPGKHFALKPDKDIERGGCRIESAVQFIDASIPVLFENLETKLLKNTSKTDES